MNPARISLLVLFLTGAAYADLPVMVHLSERQPPTNEDWFRYRFREQMLREGYGEHSCSKCAPAVGPLVLWPEIVYRPWHCSEKPAPCSSPCHLTRGLYGIRHPHPYYIANPTLATEWGCPSGCPGGQQNWRFPNNRVQWRPRDWE